MEIFTRMGLVFAALLTLASPLGTMIAGAAGSDEDGAVYQNGPQHLGVYEGNAKGDLQGVNWKFDTKGRVYASPIIHKDKCIVGSGDGNLYAIDAKEGKEIWRYQTGGAVHSTAAVQGNTVYVLSMDGKLHAVDFTTGRSLWTFSTKGEKPYDEWDPYLSSPNVVDGVVYFGSSDKSLYAVDARTGSKVWEYETKGFIHSSPAVEGDTVYFGNCEGKAYALDKRSGALKWEFKTKGYSDMPKGEIIGSPAVFDGIVYIGSKDHSIYALEAGTGKLVWKQQAYPGWTMSAPAIAEGKVIYGRTGDYKLYARDTKTGKTLWSFRAGYFIYGSPSVSGKTVYVGAFNGIMYALDLDTGKLKWSFRTKGCEDNFKDYFLGSGEFNSKVYDKLNSLPKGTTSFEFLSIPGTIIGSPWVTQDAVYFGSSDGSVYALGIK